MADDVVHLVTAKQRAEEEERAFRDAVHAEAVALLEEALALTKDRRVVGVAVAFAFEDGSYASLIPIGHADYARLIGAVADAQHRLLARSYEED